MSSELAEEMRAAKEAFLRALIAARAETDKWKIVRDILDAGYEFGRLRALDEQLANDEWTAEDGEQLKENFPEAVKQVGANYNPMVGSMELEDLFRAKRYCSAVTFIDDDIKLIYDSLEEDESIREAVTNDWRGVYAMRAQLLYLMDEWKTDGWYRKVDRDEEPNKEGVPDSHYWW
ncbi:unnamed protein product, partial [Mesorhabditis belari]|uniref:Uncharacterized protein n=1 Tax=Mesorhabditis belari TaxID=2138241 RepID=A0AAF3J3E9_9BILA